MSELERGRETMITMTLIMQIYAIGFCLLGHYTFMSEK